MPSSVQFVVTHLPPARKMWLVLLLLIAQGLVLPSQVSADAPTTIFIPQVHAEYSHAQPAHLEFPLPPCALNEQENALADLLRSDPHQRRSTISCNAILSWVARAMAEDMAARDYFDTVNPNGLGPNYLVREAGYVLPDYYSKQVDANHIASIGAGLGTAEQMWLTQAESEHLRGATQFYVDQTEFGVGYAYNPNSKFKHYWVTLIAQPGP